MTDHAQIIEDEAGEAFGIYHDQAQEGYRQLYELGVNDGMHMGLYEAGFIDVHEMFDEHDRSAFIAPWPERNTDPYWLGYNAAYANTLTPEVAACFRT